jgi:hypothetical protein
MYLIKKIFIIQTCEKLDEVRRENWMISQSWGQYEKFVLHVQKMFYNWYFVSIYYFLTIN